GRAAKESTVGANAVLVINHEFGVGITGSIDVGLEKHPVCARRRGRIINIHDNGVLIDIKPAAVWRGTVWDGEASTRPTHLRLGKSHGKVHDRDRLAIDISDAEAGGGIEGSVERRFKSIEIIHRL